MTFKTGINKFQQKYRHACLINGVREIRLSPNEIFMYLTEKYAYLANKHKLVQKYSTDNTTPQVNLIAGQATYIGGTGADNIPTDLGDVYAVTLNDTDRTPLDKLNITSLQGIVSVGGRPSGYAIDKTVKILKLNASPTESYAANSAMRLIIHYTARVEPYTGEAVGSYALVTFVNTSTDYGGSFLVDDLWSDLIVMYAVGEFIPGFKMDAIKMELDLRANMPTFWNNELPYYDGVYEEFEKNEIPGKDSGRG